MNKTIRLAGRAALLCAFLAAPALAAGAHVNEKIGYRISLPDDFEVTPDAGDLAGLILDYYLVDTFKCTKALPSKIGWTFHRHMATYFFPERSAADVAKAQEESQKGANEEGKTRVSWLINGRLYRNFKEYASDQITGFFFDGEKPAKIAGFDATIYEMKFEKGTNIPQRWMACAFKVPNGEFAIVCSCTEQHFEELTAEFKKTFNSFKLLDKAGLKLKDTDSASVDLDLGDDVDEDKLSAEELLARRKKQKEDAFKKCIDALPAGWRSFETEHFLIAHACPPKYAKEVGQHAEAVCDWMEAHFGTVGSGQVQSMIIRVYEKEADIPTGARLILLVPGTVREIEFAKPESVGWISEFRGLSTDITCNFLEGKNDQLWDRMPRWLSWGLQEYVNNGVLKGSKLVFNPEQWEEDALNDAMLEQRKFEGSNPALAPIKPVKTLITTTPDELWQGQLGRFTQAQCASVVRYLIEGPGSKNKKTASLVTHYIGNLYDLVQKVEADLEKDRKESGAKSGAGMSDEERLKAEDEEYRKRRDQAYEKVAERLLEDAFQLTFKDWDDGDWNSLDSSWGKYAEGRTK
ncbi:MAG: hypothetical protein HY812_09765 [Planctomycetes bacterium]|nr:hypothetical protein [Planctomycetota bacterium]